MRNRLNTMLVGLVAVLPFFAVSAQQAGNSAAGAKQYIQCRACHTATKSGANTVGPNLWGIMGSKAAAKPGYAYSPAMKNSGLVWTAEQMDGFLAKPNGKVPGNKMAFAGMANAQARRDLIAYLATLKGK
jgi:cytochrome c